MFAIGITLKFIHMVGENCSSKEYIR